MESPVYLYHASEDAHKASGHYPEYPIRITDEEELFRLIDEGWRENPVEAAEVAVKQAEVKTVDAAIDTLDDYTRKLAEEKAGHAVIAEQGRIAAAAEAERNAFIARQEEAVRQEEANNQAKMPDGLQARGDTIVWGG